MLLQDLTNEVSLTRGQLLTTPSVNPRALKPPVYIVM
jgi:hypothetical protein